MAQEIKSIDVNNDEEETYIKAFQNFGWTLKSSQRIYNQDSTPVASYTYNNVSYIHSTTDTVDFTKLVFERDTKIPNYKKIVALEEEFWELMVILSKGQPYIPPNSETMEDWAEYFEPEVRSPEERKKTHIIFGIATFISFMSFSVVAEAAAGEGAFFIALLIFAGIIFLWYKKNKANKRKALLTAIQPHPSVYRENLQSQYNEVIKQITIFRQSAVRTKEILLEADQLLLQ